MIRTRFWVGWNIRKTELNVNQRGGFLATICSFQGASICEEIETLGLFLLLLIEMWYGAEIFEKMTSGKKR